MGSHPGHPRRASILPVFSTCLPLARAHPPAWPDADESGKPQPLLFSLDSHGAGFVGSEAYDSLGLTLENNLELGVQGSTYRVWNENWKGSVQPEVLAGEVVSASRWMHLCSQRCG